MDYVLERYKMVEGQLKARGIHDIAVLEAMQKVPRHQFVGENLRNAGYRDSPLGIGEGQTISQPYMVALMTEVLEIKKSDRILEIGTGSGYQTAILAELCWEVYSIERIGSLGLKAKEILDSLGYNNVEIKIGDGSCGWAEKAPFQGIIITAGTPQIPEPLLEQLDPGGKMVLPLGESVYQTLVKITKTDQGWKKEELTPCVFVKLIGEYGWKI